MVVLINWLINIDNEGSLLDELINGSLALEVPIECKTARASLPANSYLRCPQKWLANRFRAGGPHHGALCPPEGSSALQSSRLSTPPPSQEAPRSPGHPAPWPGTSSSPKLRASAARSQTPDSGLNREDSEAQWVASSRETSPNLPTCLSTDPVFFRDAVRNRWWLLKIPWFLCQFSYFLAGAFSFNKDWLRFFFTFFWNRFWEFWHRRNNLSCYCRNNFSALLLCHSIRCIYAVVRATDKAKKIGEEMNTIALLVCVATCCAVYIWTQFASISNH